MKNAGAGGNQGGKRRWKILGMGVLFLVLLSMLGPLVFLLGIYSGFRSAPTTSTGFISDEPRIISEDFTEQTSVDKFSMKTEATFSKGVAGVNTAEVKDDLLEGNASKNVQLKDNPEPPATSDPISSKNPDGQHGELTEPSENRNLSSKVNETSGHRNVSSKEMMDKQCESRFGSYCLWREENKEIMKDLKVKRMKDQLFVARAYYPSVAKLPAHEKLSIELKQNIQEFERVLSESTSDSDLPPEIRTKIAKMKSVIIRAKAVVLECGNVDKKLRQILDMTEDEANFHMKQSAFLHQLSVQTKLKSHHCLSMKLTVDYFRPQNPSANVDSFSSNGALSYGHNYVIFSVNVLAVSVVINSTVMHAQDSGSVMFRVLTDRQNYYAMKLWFARHKYRDAAVDVVNLEDLNLDFRDSHSMLSSFLPMEFRVSLASDFRTEYLSVSPPAFFLLPRIFPSLNRAIVLDDDVVIQKDLSPLWSLDMGEKVIAAQQLCSVRLKHLGNYLLGQKYDENSCIPASGLNVIDMARWRELDISETYSKLRQEVRKESLLLAKLRDSTASQQGNIGESDPTAVIASALAFENLVYGLDEQWVISGLGHDYEHNAAAVRNAAALHYNGIMKPWLELGIPKYKQYWKQYLDRDDQFLGECNVNT